MFLDEWLPEDEDRSDIPLARRRRRGHEELVLALGRDIGFDPLRWHEALSSSESDELGYRWSNGHRSFPRRIREAMANTEWRAAVAELAASKASGTQPAESNGAEPKVS